MKPHVDFVSSIVFLILGVYMFVSGINYYNDANARFNLAIHNSPGLFPMLISIGIIICAVMLLIRSLKQSALKDHITKSAEGAVSFIKSPVALKAALGIMWMLLYVYILLPRFNFVIGTMVYLVGFMLFLRATSIVKIVLISSATVGLTYVVFGMFFRVTLP